jgi:hypothetical protein
VGLESFGLSRSDLNNPRNGFVALTAIEEAFDALKLCFIYDPFKVWIPLIYSNFFLNGFFAFKIGLLCRTCA